MNDKEYLIFCDESDRVGKYYSNFYGGVLVSAHEYERVTRRLNEQKTILNLKGEVKWEKVTERYLEKYKNLVSVFFSLISFGELKVRIMFRQNAQRPRNLPSSPGLQYFLLYYQFIKHAFGIAHSDPNPHGTSLRLYFDKLPDTKERIEQFKGFLGALQHSPGFKGAHIRLGAENITEVRSHDHVLLQCLDIVLGSMSFRLNEKHKHKIPGKRRRGKRTVAKEALYRVINGEICKIYPRFNVGVTTSTKGDHKNRWLHPYRHWCFQPKEFEYDEELTKRGVK